MEVTNLSATGFAIVAFHDISALKQTSIKISVCREKIKIGYDVRC
jgi:hypothetical protein